MEHRRPPYVLALALVLLMLAPLAVDTARALGGSWSFHPIRRVGDDMAEAAGLKERQRFVNIFIGVAVREVAGGEPDLVIAPKDLDALSNRPPDVIQGKSYGAVYMWVLEPMLGERVSMRDYDPHLSDAQVKRLLAATERREIDWKVVGLVGREGADKRVVLHVDERNEFLYAVPYELSPLAEEAR